MKKILFISWDGPQTSYMEGLFLPIFNEVSKNSNYKFHVIQFTWADQQKIESIKKLASAYHIEYTALPIQRKPTPALGSFFTVYTIISKLKDYIVDNQIDIVMPRSTMPAMMVSRLKLKNLKIVFDADGLPIEERVDFTGLSKKSLKYKILKREENRIINQAEIVLTRSQKAIEHHIHHKTNSFINKFAVVLNGKSTIQFDIKKSSRISIRKKYDINHTDFVFIYSGSLDGKKYAYDEILEIFKKYSSINKDSKLIILSKAITFAKSITPKELLKNIIFESVSHEKVPEYLNAADIGFVLIQPMDSMKAVSAIKLGEYLLMGLPVIASKGIGDSEAILKESDSCHLYNHSVENRVDKAIQFLKTVNDFDKQQIRELGIKYFSLEQSAESYIKALDQL